uniref:Uncharacterized protein n=1 Tax=Arundo donax TaxID=35708 RepID=A0A0A9BGY4_ARUDO
MLLLIIKIININISNEAIFFTWCQILRLHTKFQNQNQLYL